MVGNCAAVVPTIADTVHCLLHTEQSPSCHLYVTMYVCEYNRIVLVQAPDDLYLIHACIGLLPITCYNL